MPHLTALGRRGVVFTRHHAVYPTVTRVNASSISTGTYPGRHGLMGNSVFFPRVDALRFLDTADRLVLSRIAAAEGRLLTAPTLGEVLQAAGHRMLVASSAGTEIGQALHDIRDSMVRQLTDLKTREELRHSRGLRSEARSKKTA